MKHKVFLPLLEQIIMIGLFAIVAVICLQGFALSNRISTEQAIQDQAVVAAQNTAETLKSTHGDLSAAASLLSGKVIDDSLIILYDSQGKPTLDADAEEFRVCAQITESSDELLGSSIIQIIYRDEIIYSLTVGWQKDLENEN